LEGDAISLQAQQETVPEKVPQKESLAETAVSTVKRRFSHDLYSKERRGQKNESRLKVLTYNLSIIARLPAQFE
jgi:hypothetical protein